MRIRIYPAILLMALTAACEKPVEPLTEQDVIRYIHAYNNIRAISPELLSERVKSDAISVLTCARCESLMRKAAQDAGFPELNAFLLLDLRLSKVLKRMADDEASRLLGRDGESDAVACDNLPAGEHEAARTARAYCTFGTAQNRFIVRTGAFVVGRRDADIQDADVLVVAPHFEVLRATLTDEALLDEFNRARAGIWRH